MMRSKKEGFIDTLRSMKTQRLYSKILSQYYRFINDDEQLIGVTTALKFLKSCEKRGIENVSIATYTFCLRSFLKFLDTPDRELVKLRPPLVGSKIKRAIDEQHWEQFLMQPKTLRDMVIAYTLLYGACRVGELRRIKVGDVNFDENMIVIKGSREAKVAKTIQINDDTKEIIYEYVKTENLNKSDNLITLSERRIEQLVKQWAISAGVPHAKEITPHSLRRSLGRAFYLKTGKDIEKTRMALRQKSVVSTQHYLSVQEEEVHSDYKKMFG